MKKIPLLENLYKLPSLYDIKRFSFHIIFYPVRKLLISNYWNNGALISKYLGNSILDAGCGTGYLIPFLPKNKHYKYVGFDPYPEMIAKAKERYPNYVFLVGDASSLNFKENEYDLVVFWNVIHHIPLDFRYSAVKECLRAGKKVIIVDLLNASNPVIRFLKISWWRITDGGYYYNRLDEWRAFIKKLDAKIVEEHVSAPFQHHYAVVLSK